MRLLTLSLLAATLPLSAQVHNNHTKPTTIQAITSAASPLAPLDFLRGTWSATTGAAGSADAKSIGSYTFAPDLDGHILSRTSSTHTCTSPKSFDCQHHDQLTIYPAAGALTALYLDSEGHVIHYAITLPDATTAVFLSTDPGPHFRLTYHLEGATMSGKFQFAPPGSDDFHSYLEWSGTKQ